MSDDEFLLRLKEILIDHGFTFKSTTTGMFLVNKGDWSAMGSTERSVIVDAIQQAFPEIDVDGLFGGAKS